MLNPKQIKLIEVGLDLFAEKGYHTTSIQEIAKAAGISKGAFYLYFQSKEDFITSAFQYFHEQITKQLEQIKRTNDEPSKSLADQITAITEYIHAHKGFITMHLREEISISNKTDQLIKQMKTENFQWMKDSILAIYGEKVSHILLDCIIQLDGLINGYFKWIIIDDIKIDRSEFGAYIVRRLDNLVQSMLVEQENALATVDQDPVGKRMQQLDIPQILLQLREKIKTLPLDRSKITELNQVVDEIEVEANKDEPKKLLIQGLLVHLQRYPVVHDECEHLAARFNMELLD
ncbi:TetR family transcriptional regulator [Ornithinibacillus sp. L9]|uniref:TetR family transcriptional regulator n=1 Tax=Ornithinibacillus caprae TaxID=2678566 RepID=A0A6N8FPD6_9BACI|nr:TetR family transcriptional regulator [Ornithinibacillus caprae]